MNELEEKVLTKEDVEQMYKPFRLVVRDPQRVQAFLSCIVAKKQWTYHVLFDINLVRLIHDYLPCRIPQFSLTYYHSDPWAYFRPCFYRKQRSMYALQIAQTMMPRTNWVYMYNNTECVFWAFRSISCECGKIDPTEWFQHNKIKVMITSQENYDRLKERKEQNIGVIFDRMDSKWNSCYATSQLNPHFVHLFVSDDFRPDFGEFQYRIEKEPDYALVRDMQTNHVYVLK